MQGNIGLNKVMICGTVKSYFPDIEFPNPNTQNKRVFSFFFNDRNSAFEGIAENNRGLRIIM